MKEAEDEAKHTARPKESRNLCLVHSEERPSLLPDPELKELIEEMKVKAKRGRLRFDEGPEAA